MQQQDEFVEAPALPYRSDNAGKADLLDKINPDKIVEEIKNRLMGREFNRQNMCWKENKLLKRNAVSEQCANDISTLILSVSNPNVSISKLKDEEIRKRAYGVMEAAIKMLIANCRVYGITNVSQITYVAEIVFSVAFITMKQCEGEGIRKMVIGSRQETHLSTDNDRSEKRGLFWEEKVMVNIAGFDTAGISGIILGWATSFFFWAIVVAGIIFVVFVFLAIRKGRRFEFPCLEIIGLGEGKIRVESTKCGWFKSKKMLFGLWDYGGEDELVAKSRLRFGKDRRINFASSIDYHDIGGTRGMICKRKDDDPEVLVPINSFKVTNSELLAEIAPADYRDVAVKILDDKRKETLTWWDENKSTVLMAGTILFAVISIILILRFAQGESAEWRNFAAKAIQNMNVQPSSAP